MNCAKCGTQLPEDAIYCPMCGKNRNVPYYNTSSPSNQPAKKGNKTAAIIIICVLVFVGMVSIALSIYPSLRAVPEDLSYSSYFGDYGDGSASIITIGYKDDVIYEMTSKYLINITDWTEEGIEEYIAESRELYSAEDKALDCMDYSVTVEGNLIIEKWDFHALHRPTNMAMLYVYDYVDVFDLGSMAEYEKALLEYGYSKQP